MTIERIGLAARYCDAAIFNGKSAAASFKAGEQNFRFPTAALTCDSDSAAAARNTRSAGDFSAITHHQGFIKNKQIRDFFFIGLQLVKGIPYICIFMRV